MDGPPVDASAVSKKRKPQNTDDAPDMPTEAERAMMDNRFLLDGATLEDLRLVQKLGKVIALARKKNSGVLDAVRNAARLAMLEMFLAAVFEQKLHITIHGYHEKTPPTVVPVFLSTRDEAVKALAAARSRATSYRFHVVAYCEPDLNTKYGKVDIDFRGKLLNSFPKADDIMLQFLTDPEHLASDLDDLDLKDDDNSDE